MSSDPSASEVPATTGNSSSKRLLDGECERKEADAENQCSQDSTTDKDLDAGNPPKRMKVEAVEEGATADENPLNAVDTSDSGSTVPPQSQPTNCKDEKDKGDDVDRVRIGGHDPADTRSIDTGIGVATSQRGEMSESLHASSPAVTRSRSTSTDKKNDNEEQDLKVESKARWRGKTNFLE